MDDNLCPLCCEELDISDQQFFPCKCGYQVCMWCWHRIRESESGLCPACRTPYGDDPHEFSAVDVEEVLKANKEKEAAAKRERERQRQQQNDGNSSDGEGIAALVGGNLKGQMEVPKDRTQLANMRVIRRNLVYAVGLPPSIANEDVLRKPDYFGQYGKINKIVLNRSQTTGGDLRRASASAYVTFFHKEDTLACILAMDGFYMDGRNVRASYGTSKYCSAFIKNVRCNNPECTYLHQMGDVEDTFTKQEIQAGYVTSGRDVLARQQQIVQQALSAASGAAGSTPRRKIGSGGPSGTGRAASSPVFPAPTFDEPAKPSAALVPPPPGAAASRATSVPSAAAFPTIAAANAASGAATTAPSTIARASSVGANVSSVKPPVGSAQAAGRKSAASAISAASIVAGVHNGSNESPAPHTTLTPLTPLKRTNATKAATKPNDSLGLSNGNTKLTSLRMGGKKNGIKTPAVASTSLGATSQEHAPAGRPEGPSSIGGAVIAAPVVVAPPVGPAGFGNGARNGMPSSAPPHGPSLSGLGGEVFTGPLKSSGIGSIIGNGNAIGSGKDKWNASALGGDPVVPPRGNGLWGNGNQGGLAPGPEVGGNVIGGSTIGGMQATGSSALASMLGINLPTGSGSLREGPDLWSNQNQGGQPPIAALNGSSMPLQGVIGSNPVPAGNGLIGGVTIGGHGGMGPGAIGGNGSKSDIALLQSLLPGVHITSGNSFGQNGGLSGIIAGNDRGQAPGQNLLHLNPGNPQQPQQWNGGLQSTIGGAPIGAVGQGIGKPNQRQAPGSIW